MTVSREMTLLVTVEIWTLILVSVKVRLWKLRHGFLESLQSLEDLYVMESKNEIISDSVLDLVENHCVVCNVQF